MPPCIRSRRCGPAWLLLAALLLSLGLPVRGVAAQTDATARLDVCGAMAEEPGFGEGGEGGVSRPGDFLRPGDKGFGCRFTLTGTPRGGLETVEARLRRPGAVPGSLAEDRWFVPARRGSSVMAAYAFADPEAIRAGTWTLDLYLGEKLLARQAFEVVADTAEPLAAPVAAHAEAAAQAPASSAGSVAPAVPVATPGAEAGPVVPAGTESPGAPPAPTAPDPSGPVPGVATAAASTAADAVPAALPPAAPLPGAKAPEAVSAAAQAPKRKMPDASAEGAAVSRPVATAPARARAGDTPQTSPTTTPPPVRFYTLQTGLFANAENAEAQAARLRARRLPACLSVEEKGGKRRYRVLSGRFGDRRAAQALRSEVTAAAGVSPLLFQVAPDIAARLRCH